MSNLKNPFGLKDEQIVHIDDVERGRKCGCICPDCRSALDAIKGDIRQHHFRHAIGHECVNGMESAIHLAAKRVIMEEKKIRVPEKILDVSFRDSRGKLHIQKKDLVPKSVLVNLDDVQEEVALHGIRADILAIKANKKCLVEVFYRHKVDEVKLAKIKAANISAIEIDLSDLSQDDLSSMDAFQSFVFERCKKIKWLHHVLEESARRDLEEILMKEINGCEARYKNEDIERESVKMKEEQEFLGAHNALKNELEYLRSIQHAQSITSNIYNHDVWKWRRMAKYKSSSGKLYERINVVVPDGDWIFDSDRRIWQAAIYENFIATKGYFCTKRVDDWLKKHVGNAVPKNCKIVSQYRRKYPKLIDPDILDIPRSWNTINKYCAYLCDLGILEYTGNHKDNRGSYWFLPKAV